MDNATRRQLLNRHRSSGFTGSIIDVFKAYEQGIDLIGQYEQQMQVARTQQEQQQGLRPQHQAGNTNASMAFPNQPPNASFNTVGMKAPIDMKQYDDKGNLVMSYEKVPPGVTDLKMSSKGGTVIETPAKMQSGGLYNYDRAMELGYEPDKFGHLPSVDDQNGMWLKSSKHPTAVKELLHGYLGSDHYKTHNLITNPEGYFGEDQLQYVPKQNMQNGGFSKGAPRVPAMSDAEMSLKILQEANAGNPAARRMRSDYGQRMFLPGETDPSTHYMASIDNYAVPLVQEEYIGGPLRYNPNPSPSKADFRFDTPEQAEYFAKNYKQASAAKAFQQKSGGVKKYQTGSFVAESTRTPIPIDPNIVKDANELSTASGLAQRQWEIDTFGYPASHSGRVTPVDSPLDYALGLGPAALRGVTQGALRNAYKLNPFANKLNNPNAFYRITGRDAFEDAMATGLVRNNQTPLKWTGPVTLEQALRARSAPFPSFAKGSPDLHYLKNADDVIFQNSGPMYRQGDVLPTGKVLRGRHWAYRPWDEANQKVASEIPVEQIFEATPHWLMGHKQIKKNGGIRKYQNGGQADTLYVNTPDHPRIQQYADSLGAYNFGLQGKAIADSTAQSVVNTYNQLNPFTQSHNAFPQTSSIKQPVNKDAYGVAPSSSHKITFMAPAPYDPSINVPVNIPIPGGQNKFQSSIKYDLWDKPKQPVVYRREFQQMDKINPSAIPQSTPNASLKPVGKYINNTRPPQTMYKQDPSVSTGQYPIGEYLWDSNSKRWKTDTWDPEMQKASRQLAIPRGYKLGGIKHK